MNAKRNEFLQNCLGDHLPSWFPLPIYSRILSKKEWLRALTNRALAKWVYDCIDERKKVEHDSFKFPLVASEDFDPVEFFLDFVTCSDGLGYDNEKDTGEEKPRYPVAGINLFEAFYLNALWKDDEHNELREFAQLAARRPMEAYVALYDQMPFLNKNLNTSVLRETENEKFGSIQAEMMNWRIPVSVDMTLDDETLIGAFKIWLAGMRGDMKEKTPKPFENEDFAKWHCYAVLPACDLLLWARASNLKYSNGFLGKIIYTDARSSLVDGTDRCRKVTRPLVDELVQWGAIERLKAQIQWQDALMDTVKTLSPTDYEQIVRGEREAYLKAHEQYGML